MSKIKITLNGEEFFCTQNQSLQNLIDKLGLDIKKVAVEKNLQIINATELAKEYLQENDKIEIVSFIGGG
jgi:sulfur carrier protein